MGDRKANQYADKALFVITEVREAGEILQLIEMRAKWRNAIGALVRDEPNPTIKSWTLFSKETKTFLCDRLFKNFRFQEGSHGKVQHQALKQIRESFRCWKSELNTKYIQKGLTPFDKYRNIIPGMWADLVAQKTTPEAVALSARNTKLA
jgi:hypothetical protein